MPRMKIRDFVKSLYFDGSTACVSKADDALIRLSTSFTLAAWIKPAKATSSGSAEMHIISKGLSSASNYSIALYLGANNLLRAALFDGSSNPPAASSDNNKVNVWQHVALTYDGVTMRLYRNGIQVGSSATTLDVGSQATVLEIGRRAKANDKYFQGRIDNVQIWNTPLTAAEISTLYFTGETPQSSALKLEWLFNEGSGSSALDTSGNSLTGTITAATYSSDVRMIPRTAAP